MREAVKDTFGPELIGSKLLDHLANGLYGPAGVIREYIQNAVDSIRKYRYKVDMEYDEPVHIEVRQDRISVYDYGYGMTLREIKNAKAIAITTKNGEDNIGYTGEKGIGIWSGFSYFKKLIIRSTTAESDCVKCKKNCETDCSECYNECDYRCEYSNCKDYEWYLTIDFEGIKKSISYDKDIIKVLNANIRLEKQPIASNEHYTIITLEGCMDKQDFFDNIAKIYATIKDICPCKVSFDNPNLLKEVHQFYDRNKLQTFAINIDQKTAIRKYNSKVTSIVTDSIKVDDKVVAECWYAFHSTKGVIKPREGEADSGFKIIKDGFTVGNNNIYTDKTLGHDFDDLNNTTAQTIRWLIGEIHIVDEDIKLKADRNSFLEDSYGRLFVKKLRLWYADRAKDVRAYGQAIGRREDIKGQQDKYNRIKKQPTIEALEEIKSTVKKIESEIDKIDLKKAHSVCRDVDIINKQRCHSIINELDAEIKTLREKSKKQSISESWQNAYNCESNNETNLKTDEGTMEEAEEDTSSHKKGPIDSNNENTSNTQKQTIKDTGYKNESKLSTLKLILESKKLSKQLVDEILYEFEKVINIQNGGE